MNPKLTKIQNILGILTAVLILLTGLGLILCCLSIYNSGSRPFNPQAIAGAAVKLAPLGIATVLAIVIGGILKVRYPASSKAPGRRDEEMTLLALRKKMGPVKEEERQRRFIRVAASVAIAAVYIYPLCYLLNSANFSVQDVTGDVAAAALIVLGASICAFGIAVITRHLIRRSIHRQIGLYKSGMETGASAPTVSRPLPIWGIRAALLLAAVCLIIAGIHNQGIADVLGKAIRICTECIGLG